MGVENSRGLGPVFSLPGEDNHFAACRKTHSAGAVAVYKHPETLSKNHT
jgi:hypothetical protein